MAILTTKYFVMSESRKYYKGFSQNLDLIKTFLNEAKNLYPLEKWGIYQFDD